MATQQPLTNWFHTAQSHGQRRLERMSENSESCRRSKRLSEHRIKETHLKRIADFKLVQLDIFTVFRKHGLQRISNRGLAVTQQLQAALWRLAFCDLADRFTVLLANRMF